MYHIIARHIELTLLQADNKTIIWYKLVCDLPLFTIFY